MQPGTLFWWLKTAESIIPYIIIYINPQTVDEKKVIIIICILDSSVLPLIALNLIVP